MQRAKAAASFAQIAAWLIWPSWDERIWAGIWAHKHRRDGPGNAMSGKMRACQIVTLVFVVHHKKPFFCQILRVSGTMVFDTISPGLVGAWGQYL